MKDKTQNRTTKQPNDLCKKFNLTDAEIKAKIDEYESDDWSHMTFGDPITGRPRIYDQPMQRISVTVPEEIVVAMKNFCSEHKMSRSEFVRQAVTEKLVC